MGRRRRRCPRRRTEKEHLESGGGREPRASVFMAAEASKLAARGRSEGAAREAVQARCSSKSIGTYLNVRELSRIIGGGGGDSRDRTGAGFRIRGRRGARAGRAWEGRGGGRGRPWPGGRDARGPRGPIARGTFKGTSAVSTHLPKGQQPLQGASLTGQIGWEGGGGAFTSAWPGSRARGRPPERVRSPRGISRDFSWSACERLPMDQQPLHFLQGARV